jgi:2-succinyl-6-hydroxy-2,4-cyclohexadiene-1-carboxylate synthase
MGDSLLLLHGFTLSSASFTPYIERLATSYRVIAPDLLGHGKTEVPKEEQRFSMTETIEDLHQLMTERTGTSFAVLGYSMGGRIALSLAVRYPEVVRALVLESASPGLQHPAEREARRKSDEALAQKIEQQGVLAFVKAWEQAPLFASLQRLPEHLLSEQRRIRKIQSSVGLSGSLRGMGTGSQPALWQQLSTLTVPTCLVSGELDTKFTLIQQEMLTHLTQAIHVQIPDAGHTPHLEQPLLFWSQVLEFLRLHVG